jgi:hypothetical protein
MNRLLAIGILLFTGLVMSVQAQTAADENAGLRVHQDTATGHFLLAWWGQSGMTYFIQQSYDLINWTYVPLIHDGSNVVDGMNFSSTDSRQFWRLQYAYNGGNSGANADFDNDGLSNQQELSYGADPFNPDTDGMVALMVRRSLQGPIHFPPILFHTRWWLRCQLYCRQPTLRGPMAASSLTMVRSCCI